MIVASRFLTGVVPVLLAGLLSACASHHRQSDATASSAAAGYGRSDMMSGMDMKTMCENHKNMMSAKTPSEREAMMDQHMKSMSPEMRQKHMAMMDAKCR